MNEPPERLLQFSCQACGYALEAPVQFAGVTAPCPMCGTPVQAPEFLVEAAPAVEAGIWEEMLSGRTNAVPAVEVEMMGEFDSGVREEGRDILPLPSPMQVEVQPVFDPLPQRPPGPTREQEEGEAVARHRRKARRLLCFDAALVLLFLGMLALGGAAIAFTEPRRAALPKAPPELSGLVVERMQQHDRQKDQAVQAARVALEELVGAADAGAAAGRLLPGSERSAGLAWPLFAGASAEDFEFIQVKRIPGTDRFLSIFEMAADPPLVLPVEETAGGARLHGLALAQQSGGLLGRFLASQGAGEGVFYVLLRPAPESMAQELRGARPDLKAYDLVAVEPAFPADGGSGCLVCLDPASEAAAIFSKRTHDPGLRPAVVKLAWRQHRESGNFVQLVSFEPNAWSRH